MIALNVEYIFQVVGGPTALLNLLEDMHPGARLNYAQVQMWKHRGQIPGPWIAPVLYAMFERGHTLTTLLRDTGEDPFADPTEPGAAVNVLTNA